MSRRILHSLFCICMIWAGAVPGAPATPKAKVAALYPEVQLRRIHLVRPDLIPYPIAYLIQC